MLRVTYKGIVPEGYMDSGTQENTIYIDYDVDTEDILKIAKYDCNQCTDVQFTRIVSVQAHNGNKIPVFAMIYKGVRELYDTYFKETFYSYITECYNGE